MAVDMFLKINDIKGECQKDGHKDEIDIESFSFGATQTGSFHRGGAGGGTGKAEFTDCHVDKLVDKSSPIFYKFCTGGQAIKEATIYSQKAGDGQKPMVYYEIKMSDIIVSSIHNAGSSGGDSIMESLTLNCAKIEFVYTPQRADGGQEGKVQAMYDVRQNVTT